MLTTAARDSGYFWEHVNHRAGSHGGRPSISLLQDWLDFSRRGRGIVEDLRSGGSKVSEVMPFDHFKYLFLISCSFETCLL